MDREREADQRTHAHIHLKFKAQNQPCSWRRPQPQSQPGDASVHQLGWLAGPQRVKDKRRRGRTELAPSQTITGSHLESVWLSLPGAGYTHVYAYGRGWEGEGYKKEKRMLTDGVGFSYAVQNRLDTFYNGAG